MAIFATTERLTFNNIQRHHGPVLKLVDVAESYIKSNIHWKVEFTGARQRTEIPVMQRVSDMNFRKSEQDL